jgi:outer membrane protein assembly factor BamA
VKVVFDIKDEQKIRIRTVDFDGIEHFDDWQLRWAMKKTRESHVLGALMGGSTYTEEQYGQDIEKVREVYLNNGYVDVVFAHRRWSTRTATPLHVLEAPEAVARSEDSGRGRKAVPGGRHHG